jgi:cobalt/nickel transport system ATP-binding protein
MDLKGYEDRVTWKLSEGEKRRVCIASVLAMEGDFLLLDEPTSDLDAASCQTLISVLQNCGMGFMIVSHDADFLDRMCDRRLVLENGKLELVS